MATTAKKPSKKPVKRAAKKPAAKKTPAQKATVINSDKKPVLRKSFSFAALSKLHLVSAIVSAVLAVASALLLVPATAQFIMSYMTDSGTGGADKVVLAPATRVVWEVELGYLLAGIFAISAVASLLLATLLKKRYETTVTNKTSGFRWLFVGITSALLVEYASLIAGIQDIATLKLIGALVLVTALFSWLAERDNKGVSGAKWLAYSIALVAGTIAWLPLITSMVGTPFHGMERFSWYVYAFAGVVLAGVICFAYNLYRQIRGRGAGNYLFAERNYVLIDLVMKVAAGAVIIYALLDK